MINAVTRVFFTYVWGEPTSPAWPLTFATKATRRFAVENVSDGDLVFTVATRQEPTRADLRGLVTGLYRLSDLELNTADYDLPRDDRPEHDTVTRFPYCLHPLQVWSISERGKRFSELVGPLTPKHHLQAQSGLVELDQITSKPLLELSRLEVAPIMLPSTQFGRGLVARKISKLAPKHSGSFTGTFGEHALWYVYSLALRDQRGKTLAYKIGYSHAPELRAAMYNVGMATEVTGLEWHLNSSQPTASEDAARAVEQALLQKFHARKLPSNGEIITAGRPDEITVAVATFMREMSLTLQL